jgi:hypothetical protein
MIGTLWNWSAPLNIRGRRTIACWFVRVGLGESLGGDAMTPVFILLLRDRTALDKSIAESKDFDQAAWGIATTLPDKLAKDPA